LCLRALPTAGLWREQAAHEPCGTGPAVELVEDWWDTARCTQRVRGSSGGMQWHSLCRSQAAHAAPLRATQHACTQQHTSALAHTSGSRTHQARAPHLHHQQQRQLQLPICGKRGQQLVVGLDLAHDGLHTGGPPGMEVRLWLMPSLISGGWDAFSDHRRAGRAGQLPPSVSGPQHQHPMLHCYWGAPAVRPGPPVTATAGPGLVQGGCRDGAATWCTHMVCSCWDCSSPPHGNPQHRPSLRRQPATVFDPVFLDSFFNTPA